MPILCGAPIRAGSTSADRCIDLGWARRSTSRPSSEDLLEGGVTPLTGRTTARPRSPHAGTRHERPRQLRANVLRAPRIENPLQVRADRGTVQCVRINPEVGHGRKSCTGENRENIDHCPAPSCPQRRSHRIKTSTARVRESSSIKTWAIDVPDRNVDFRKQNLYHTIDEIAGRKLDALSSGVQRGAHKIRALARKVVVSESARRNSTEEMQTNSPTPCLSPWNSQFCP